MRRLYRSHKNRMLAGVAGGIAEFFNIDPTIVRVVWVVGGLVALPMTAPIALVLYIALAFIIPPAPLEEERSGETPARREEPR
ncbi:MAG: PspC domain-containing protein [Chloroflexi bacterium]|nr:PspC domain-containing protein [Chloroflexota bacterium]